MSDIDPDNHTFHPLRSKNMSRIAIPKMVKHSRRMSQEAVGGLDADLKARENAKRDGGLESDCCAFLSALTGAEINDMMEDLKVSTKKRQRRLDTPLQRKNNTTVWKKKPPESISTIRTKINSSTFQAL